MTTTTNVTVNINGTQATTFADALALLAGAFTSPESSGYDGECTEQYGVIEDFTSRDWNFVEFPDLWRPTMVKTGEIKVKRFDPLTDSPWMGRAVFDSKEEAKEYADSLYYSTKEKIHCPKLVPAVGQLGYYVTLSDGEFVVKEHTRAEQDDELVKAKRLSRNSDNMQRIANELNELLRAMDSFFLG